MSDGVFSEVAIARLSCHAIECPSCRAEIQQPCRRKDGTPLMGYHLPRHYALRQLKRELRAFIKLLAGVRARRSE